MSARRFRGLLSVTGRSRGSSLVELALVLPILLILVLGVIDFGRALQFNNVLIAMSREGANLAARTTADPQAIITAMVVSSHPLDMPGVGMIYVSSFSGQANGQGVLQSQARYGAGNLSLVSRIYKCSGWSSGNCLVPSLFACSSVGYNVRSAASDPNEPTAATNGSWPTSGARSIATRLTKRASAPSSSWL